MVFQIISTKILSFLKSYSYLSEKDYEATDDRVVRQGLRLEDVTNVGVNCKAIKKGESDA